MLDRVAGSVNQLRSLTDTVAHELKTPVTSIRGRLENALTSEDPARWRDTAILAIEDLDRLAAFVTTTLDLSEAEGGGLGLHVAPVDFGALVRDVLALYEPSFADRQHELRQTIEDGIILELDRRPCSARSPTSSTTSYGTRPPARASPSASPPMASA